MIMLRKKDLTASSDNTQNFIFRCKFEPQNIYNTDESGLTTVQDPKGVISSRGKKQVGSITAQERGELVTYVETISALGVSIPPLFIFPSAKYIDSWVENGPPGCIGCAGRSGSGWMTNAIFSQVYLPHFVKHAKATIENPVLLILDDHESDVSIDSLNFARANGIHMLTLPPHCSHKLQLLGKAVYGPLKTYYNRSMDSFVRSHTHIGKAVNIYNIPTIANTAHQQAMTIGNIVSGFRSTGIFSFNRDVFQECEFLAAAVSERPDPNVVPNEVSSQPELPTSVPSTSRDIPTPAPSTSKDSPSSSASRDPATPTPSTSRDHPTPSTSRDPTTYISPQQILPCPSYVRKTNNVGRKKRKAAIVTDTPEKEEIENEKIRRLEAKKPQKKKSAPRPKSPSLSGSASDEPKPTVSDHSSDEMSEHEDESVETAQLEEKELVVGTFGLVEYLTKRSIYYYAAQIEGISEGEYQIDCLRRISNTNRFRKPDKKDIDHVEFSSIKRILLPSNVGLNKRAIGCYTFNIDLSDTLNIC